MNKGVEYFIINPMEPQAWLLVIGLVIVGFIVIYFCQRGKNV